MTTVLATSGQGPDRPQEVSYTDAKVIGNGSFGVVYQAKLVDTSELVAIKKVLQDKRFKVSHHPLPCSWRPVCFKSTLSLSQHRVSAQPHYNLCKFEKKMMLKALKLIIKSGKINDSEGFF